MRTAAYRIASATFAVVAVLHLSSAAAHAVPNLDGQQVLIEGRYPTFDDIINSAPVVGGPGGPQYSLTNTGGDVVSFDLAGDSITITFDAFDATGVFGPPAAFNGWSFTDDLETIDAIEGVAISTNMVDLDLSRLDFDADWVSINFDGLSFNDSTFAVIQLVPEPSTASLLTLGLLGLATVGRRRTAA